MRTLTATLCTALLACLAIPTLNACTTGTGDGDGDGDGDADGGGGDGDIGDCVVEDIAVKKPVVAATLKTGGTPNLDCFASPRVVGPSQTVTIEGCADIFGRDQNPQDDTPRYGEVDFAVDEVAGPLQDLARGCASKGYYRLEGVPTHVPLIIRTRDLDTGTLQRAMPTYTYDVVFYNEDIVDGVIKYEANMVYLSTYDSIPVLAGKQVEGQRDVTDGVGRAVIAGEIHDCDDVIIQGAAVSSSAMDGSTKIVYFDGEEDPSPDVTISTTNEDGLYALINAATDDGGHHTIAAGILDPACDGEDCQCVSLGSSDIQTFPDSVTILTLRGAIPVIGDVTVDAGSPSDAGATADGGI